MLILHTKALKLNVSAKILVLSKRKIVETTSNILREMKKKAKKKRVPPTSYNTMPYYFPTEQIDIVRKKMKIKRVRQRKTK